LKSHIVDKFPDTELLVEIVKYETENFLDVLDNLELGVFNEIQIDFTDSESSGEDGEFPYTSGTTCIPIDYWNPDWKFDNEAVINFSQDWNSYLDNHTIPEKIIPANKLSPKISTNDISTGVSDIKIPSKCGIFIVNESVIDENISEESANTDFDIDGEHVAINDSSGGIVDISAESAIGSIYNNPDGDSDIGKNKTILDKNTVANQDFEDDLIFPNLNYLSSWRY
tara:strand:- start:29 stop:706 length:678 start_codon:yes stop_codon:yes gene_type:complete